MCLVVIIQNCCPSEKWGLRDSSNIKSIAGNLEENTVSITEWGTNMGEIQAVRMILLAEQTSRCSKSWVYSD